MPDLIAQGPSSEDRWRRELPGVGVGSVVIGRSGSDWNVGWDGLISRRHVQLQAIDEDRVEVTCVATARNPVFHRGRKSTKFVLVPGEHFVIGRTSFTLANRPSAADSSAIAEVTEHAFDHLALRRRHFRDAASRIEMLSRLPDLIASSTSDEELLVRVTSVLLQATPAASAVAVVTASDETEDAKPNAVEILHFDSRASGNTCPSVSSRLVRSANEKRESVLHLWADVPRDTPAFTISEDVDWAFCVPLRNDACPGWAIYVSGQLACQTGFNVDQSMQAAPDDLEDDVKFAELVGTTLANLRQSSRLQRRQAAMQHFFAPIVMDALAAKDTNEVLEPREADLSVLFCDLRGFSRRSEQDADHLLELLAQVSDALGVMTRHILDTGGVIGDFHGDAAMGFWGWPLEQPDSALRAVEAAVKIRAASSATCDTGQSAETSGSLESGGSSSKSGLAGVGGFRCGIGIASGRAVAGRIGTVDQVKVTAFGPVVNLASRLEGITKPFGVEIIVDEATALALQGNTESDTSSEKRDHHRIRTRRLARVRPAGFQSAMDIFEALPQDDAKQHSLTDEQIQEYERSLDALIRGDWEEAHERLHALPAWDRPKDMLLSTILRHNRVAPPNWTGVIDMAKS